MERTTKQGRTIIATVKSFLVTLKEDVQVGKLNRRGSDTKVFASVLPKKELKAGDKVCLRLGVRKFNGNFLVYAHGYGWIEVEDMEKTFASKSNNYEDLLELDYLNLSNEMKLKLINKHFPGYFENLTKAETLLMAYYDNKDLKEVEAEISCDKSLKYKVKNHSDKYAEAMLKKIEPQLA